MSSGGGEVVAGIAAARGAVERPDDLILVLSLLNLEKFKTSLIYLISSARSSLHDDAPV